jgi:c-di-GMP-binding flagellar brake protein YcgR
MFNDDNSQFASKIVDISGSVIFVDAHTKKKKTAFLM